MAVVIIIVLLILILLAIYFKKKEKKVENGVEISTRESKFWLFIQLQVLHCISKQIIIIVAMIDPQYDSKVHCRCYVAITTGYAS